MCSARGPPRAHRASLCDNLLEPALGAHADPVRHCADTPGLCFDMFARLLARDIQAAHSEPVEHLERQRGHASARPPCEQGGRALDETPVEHVIECRKPRQDAAAKTRRPRRFRRSMRCLAGIHLLCHCCLSLATGCSVTLGACRIIFLISTELCKTA